MDSVVNAMLSEISIMCHCLETKEGYDIICIAKWSIMVVNESSEL